VTPEAGGRGACRHSLAALLALAAVDVAAAPAAQPAALLDAAADAIEATRQVIERARGYLAADAADLTGRRDQVLSGAREACDRLAEARAVTRAAADGARWLQQ